MTKGIVFDIQRFSINDGPGIRTTVFLKGCPLRCLWCHNPESYLPGPEKWTRNTAFGPKEEIVGKEMSIQDVFAEVLPDVDYYKRSGGGLTISGGEPLLQPLFTSELLLYAHEQEIHTALETCGHAPESSFEAVLPYVDLFLFDYKATDAVTHTKLTGTDNGLILKNLDYLYHKGANIILRCPLVQGINDSDEHLSGIAAVAKRFPNLQGVEIMAYHNLGQSKWSSLGKIDPLPGLPNTAESTKKRWIATLHNLGCASARLG